ncbi:conserved hypothetical protein [Enterobacterales bacterium 8AC]|nr:conserved hypothetical protein [Enterobacterales bacterium 8AC]
MTQTEWDDGTVEDTGPALYVVKSALNAAFTQEGQLIIPLEFKIVGEVQRCVDALKACHITARCADNVVTLVRAP